MTVEQLLSTVESAELTEWMAFLQIEMERDQPDPTDTWRKAFNAYG